MLVTLDFWRVQRCLTGFSWHQHLQTDLYLCPATALLTLGIPCSFCSSINGLFDLKHRVTLQKFVLESLDRFTGYNLWEVTTQTATVLVDQRGCLFVSPEFARPWRITLSTIIFEFKYIQGPANDFSVILKEIRSIDCSWVFKSLKLSRILLSTKSEVVYSLAVTLHFIDTCLSIPCTIKCVVGESTSAVLILY